MNHPMINRKGMVCSIEDIKSKLPHRYPFLMVDRIIEQSPGECIGVKNITFNEPCFLGHFPSQSIMPGVLITEAMVQTAAFVGYPSDGENFKRDIKKLFLTSINVKLHAPVIPGDRMIIKVRLIKTLGSLTKFRGEIEVDGDRVADGEFNVANIQ